MITFEPGHLVSKVELFIELVYNWRQVNCCGVILYVSTLINANNIQVIKDNIQHFFKLKLHILCRIIITMQLCELMGEIIIVYRFQGNSMYLLKRVESNNDTFKGTIRRVWMLLNLPNFPHELAIQHFMCKRKISLTLLREGDTLCTIIEHFD